MLLLSLQMKKNLQASMFKPLPEIHIFRNLDACVHPHCRHVACFCIPQIFLELCISLQWNISLLFPFMLWRRWAEGLVRFRHKSHLVNAEKWSYFVNFVITNKTGKCPDVFQKTSGFVISSSDKGLNPGTWVKV